MCEEQKHDFQCSERQQLLAAVILAREGLPKDPESASRSGRESESLQWILSHEEIENRFLFLRNSLFHE